MNQIRGKLITWKQDKGFGFIRPDDHGKDIFVHIRDFGNINRQPKVGDIVKFQALEDGKGKFRAADVMIEGVARSPSQHFRRAATKKNPVWRSDRTGNVGIIIFALAVVGITIAVFRVQPAQGKNINVNAPIKEVKEAFVTPFKCEGKEHYSQMSSCAEAKFYLRSCPNTKMDGDGDGIPCEQQWC